MRFFGRSPEPAPAVTTQPAQAPTLRTANVGAAYRSQRVGGDFYDFVAAGDGRLLLAIFDIAGRKDNSKDTARELDARAATVQQVLRSRGPALVEESGNLNDALTGLALELNRAILGSARGVHNTPAFLAGFDEEFGMMSYVNAGHTPALMSDEDGVTALEAGGVPLGLFSHVVHEARTVVVRPGAVVLAVSKGVVEAKAERDQEFGLDRVRQFLAQRKFNSAQDLCREVLHQVEQFMAAPSFWGPKLAFSGFHDHEAGGETANDMTAVALMRPAVGATVSARAS
ncbi:MAG: SpoIIE family protein phosphatase [Acidobacteriaceae bacterium]